MQHAFRLPFLKAVHILWHISVAPVIIKALDKLAITELDKMSVRIYIVTLTSV